ncbi:MAG: hypothetical protein ACTH6A_06530 [Brachybacterium tyrofermentans]|uniref:hypothetical protein n=1 Tax=Brachybacterium tyrofermentans TaxID=47848 RepID=UPI003F8EF3CA
MTSTSVREQIQAGIDARIDQKIINAAAPMTLAYRTMLGLDGTSLDDAVEAAYTPTGPPRDVIRARIEFRRAHPDQLVQTVQAAA